MNIKVYDTQIVLRGKFDIETHKEAFVNYLEVIIRENGTVEYAVPSHQEKLINVATKSLGITREQLFELCPKEYYGDFIRWLCKITNCVSVWNDFHIGAINEMQRSTLQTLKTHKLYRGEIRSVLFAFQKHEKQKNSNINSLLSLNTYPKIPTFILNLFLNGL